MKAHLRIAQRQYRMGRQQCLPVVIQGVWPVSVANIAISLIDSEKANRRRKVATTFTTVTFAGRLSEIDSRDGVPLRS